MADFSLGYVRVAAAVPLVHVADPAKNIEEMRRLIARAWEKNVQMLVFPELCLTGYTCKDTFQQESLQRAAVEALGKFLEYTIEIPMVMVVGMPLRLRGVGLPFNVAVICCAGKILGVIPKLYPPTDGEFEERRWFSPGAFLTEREITLCGQKNIPIGTDIVVDVENISEFVISGHVCQDGWQRNSDVPYEATVVFNISASTAIVAKENIRRLLIESRSCFGYCAYVYASCGYGESTDDVVFDGDARIAENGSIRASSKRFSRESQLVIADVDLEHLVRERALSDSWAQEAATHRLPSRKVTCRVNELDLRRDGFYAKVDPHPMVPSDPKTRDERCSEIFSIQTNALGFRLEGLAGYQGKKTPEVALGLSGGLDSLQSLLVLLQIYEERGWDRKGIHVFTLDGYGTTPDTKENVYRLCQVFGLELKEISIVEITNQLLRSLGHEPCMKCLKCENAQARVRTLILMTDGFVVGTGDLSEALAGWCTYNGDHMSMYNPNAGVFKTLMQHLVRWVAERVSEDGMFSTGDQPHNQEIRDALIAVLDTPISPGLTKAEAGKVSQKTEDIIGPYELRDFFGFLSQRRGYTPRKIFFLALQAGINGKNGEGYLAKELLRWLRDYYNRRFAAQFKMNAVPNGPLVGTVGVSPRGKNRWPSDIDGRVWRDEANALRPDEFVRPFI